MKRCVECQAETVERKHETVTADVCPDGHGLWLRQSELLRAVRTAPGRNHIGNRYDEGRSLTLAADHDVELGDSLRMCPMCNRSMGSVDYAFDSGVLVDVCAKHGVWLDEGELEALERTADRTADPSTPEGAEHASRLDAVRDAEEEVVELRLSLGDALGGMLRSMRN